MISFPKAHRQATGLVANDDITVVLELDSGVREVLVPSDLKKALKVSGLKSTFDNLAYSKRKEYVRQVNEAKADETKNRRIDKIIAELSS